MKILFDGGCFTHISDDSRQVDKNTAFLLTKTSAPYQNHAQKNGVQVFLTPQILKESCGSLPKIIGITGTNGKTTTAAALYSILLDLGYNVALLGTRGFFINEKQIKAKSLTTPPLLENYENLLIAKQWQCDFFVMEVSSHAITQGRIDSLEFALKILTNITSDHLDYHNSLEHYIAVKNSFFDDGCMILLNSDENKIITRNFKALRTYGIEHNSTYKVNAYSIKNGISAQIQYGKEIFPLFSPLFGRHNLYNLLAASSAAHILTQADLNTIFQKIEHFAGVKGRMEQVSQEPLVIIDFAHTEDGMKQIFESFLHQDIIALFGAGGDRDKSKRKKMGAVAEKYAKRIYITSDNPRSEDPQSIIEDILEGIKDKSKCIIQPERPLAIKQALKSMQKGEVLLILGKGDEEEQIIGSQKIAMNDALLVQEMLLA